MDRDYNIVWTKRVGRIRFDTNYHMKSISILLIFGSFIFCQDSTYWFDFKTLKKSIPKTPKVLDKIFEDSQFNMLHNPQVKSYEFMDGFRLQLYDDLSVINANKTFDNYKKKLPDSLYLEFDAPFYKIRYGNFKTKREAELQKQNLMNNGMKDIWIIRSRIKN